MRVEISEIAVFNNFIRNLYPEVQFNQITGISIDSRKVAHGDIYIAIQGARVDGHEFISKAVEAGACIVISEKKNEISVPQIIVKSTTDFLIELASAWWQQFSYPAIAITGSNGKTTTKELLAHILSDYLSIASIHGNYNSTIGLPLSLFSLRLDNEYAVLEIGSNSPGEIRILTKLIKPKLGLITNIYAAHIGNFETIENIAREKSDLFYGLGRDGAAFVNVDDPFLFNMDINSRIISYGFTSSCDFRGKIQKNGKFSFLYVNDKKVNMTIESKAMAHNILAAYSIASTIGISHQNIAESVQTFILPEGRGNIIRVNEYTIIDDTYNANLQSTITGIRDAMGFYPECRIVLIIGDMFELGDYTDAHHQFLGEYISEKKPSLVLTLGEHTKITSEICLKNGIKAFHFSTHESLISSLDKYLKPGDIVYVKGSRGMKMDKIIKGLS